LEGVDEVAGTGNLGEALPDCFAVVVVKERGESVHIDELGLLEESALLLGEVGDVGSVGQCFENATRDITMFAGGLADLVKGGTNERLVGVFPSEEADVALLISMDCGGERTSEGGLEAGAEVVDAIHRGHGIIDPGREGAEGDLDELANTVFEILLGSSNGASEQGALNRFDEIGIGLIGRWALDYGDRGLSLGYEVACATIKKEDGVGLGRDIDQPLETYGLHVAGDSGYDLPTLEVIILGAVLWRRVVDGREHAIDGLLKNLMGVVDDVLGLDHRDDVMNEVDEESKADEHEDKCEEN